MTQMTAAAPGAGQATRDARQAGERAGRATLGLDVPASSVAWLLLACAALVLAALFAAFVAAARVPGLPGTGPGELLQRNFGAALVQHVTLAKLVWLLGAAASAWALVAALPAGLAGLLFGLAAAGVAAIVAAFFTPALPVLNNYVPVLDHPLFLGGLATFTAVVGVTALAAAFRGRQVLNAGVVGLPVRIALLLAVIPVGVTAFSLLVSLAELPFDRPLMQVTERLFWEPGHTLQFVFTALLVAAWLQLLPLARTSRALLPGLWLTVIPVMLTPVLHFAWPPDGEQSRRAFTLLMMLGTWPGPLLVAAALLRDRQRVRRPLDVAALAAMLSMALFVVGLLVGLLIRGETTTVPAHYHATVGATTLAGLGVVLTLFDARRDSLLRAAAPLLAYAAGFLLIVAGFALAGSQRVPRKLPGASVETEPLAWFGLVTMAVGASAAVAGVLWFGARLVAALRAPRRARAGDAAGDVARRLDRRLPALAGTAAVVFVAGGVIAWVNSPPRPEVQDLSTVVGLSPEAQAELRARFNQGVLMLHAREHEHALTAFHRVLQIAPRLPEAHVNLGFALLGLDRPREASAAFGSAIELRPRQLNAYYGLAVALDASGDRPGAIGAMRSYAHLAPRDDPFRRKAESALWEWEAERSGARLPTPPNGKNGSP